MYRFLVLLAMLVACPVAAQDLYRMPAGETRWISPENPTGARAQAALENKGAKGHAFDSIAPHASLTLADIRGSGIIDRIWLTIDDRSFARLRALRLDIWWDGAATPAVSVPLGDFFLQNAGEMKAMDTALFGSAEARSFLSCVPMPFRKGARIVVTNESAEPLPLIFFDVDYRAVTIPDDALYFHAWWSRDRATKPGQDFVVLPHVPGRGRFLGLSVGVQTNPVYGTSWWGEGEVRFTLGNDTHPTLSGTGTEDYIGDAWGQAAFVDRNAGAPVADEKTGRWSFYRFHIPDPVIFDDGLSVTYEQIGGAPLAEARRLREKGAPMIPITVAPYDRGGLMRLLDSGRSLDDPSMAKDGWANFYRSDDVSAVAYFYLDRPENGLPPLAPVAQRTADLRPPSP